MIMIANNDKLLLLHSGHCHRRAWSLLHNNSNNNNNNTKKNNENNDNDSNNNNNKRLLLHTGYQRTDLI